MATVPSIKLSSRKKTEDPAAKIARLLEEHFDEMGWSEAERNERVARAGVRVDAAVARAKSRLAQARARVGVVAARAKSSRSA
jgi:hypothetical protein